LATAALHYAAAAASDRGRKRANNQDSFGFSIEHGVYAVCDGMGGAAGGEIASSIAVEEVLRVLTGRDPSVAIPKVAEDAVCAANSAVYARAERNQNLSGMGTTLVALLVEQSQVWVVNVGDSRCYRLREDRIEQLTLDHSLVEEQVRLGRMTRPEALRSPLRNVITRAVGTQTCVTPDCFQFEAQPGDLFLLCSDGLNREVPDAEIQELLTMDEPLQERANRLIEAANKAGGRDNITCILVRAVAEEQ
jgi:PPM family protein phosphatase